MENPLLKFLRNEAGEKEGLGDAGIETFLDSPYASCAREAGQNSRDAARELPVKITFNVLHLKRSDFPSRDMLEEALSACLEEASKDRDKEFFNNALKVIRGNNIPALEIADYNTKGLVGPPDEEGTPFHSLVKGSGVTSKEHADSGGSFGIGKNASFAISDLHTVFYATKWEAPASKKEIFSAQGKVKLVSHTNATGDKMRATGYWGNPAGFNAISGQEFVPPWMRRDKIGTSIFCMGFRIATDWPQRMAYSLVTNFFCAIHREEMIFEVDEKSIQINKNTLENMLTRNDITDAAERAGHLSDITFSQQLYRCLVSSSTKEELLDIPNLGKIRLRVLIEEGMPRRVGFVRNGMLITDNLKNFGHPLARFPGSKDFIVLAEPADSETSKFLKNLENPSHDGFSAERIADATKRAKASRAMKQLGKELREAIKNAAGVQHEDSVVLEELGKYFADEGANTTPPSPHAESDPERFTYKPTKKIRPPAPVTTSPNGGEHGGSSSTGAGGGSNGGGTGKGTGSGSGGRGSQGERQTTILRDARNRIRPDRSGGAIDRELHFTPSASGKIELKVEATGIDRPEVITIIKTTDGNVTKSGSIILSVIESERKSITVRLDEPYDGPIELTATPFSDSPRGEA